MERKKIKPIIYVVEGKKDSSRLKIALGKNLQIIETNGSHIKKDLLRKLKFLSKENILLIITDPDFQGKRIRNKIIKEVPDSKHVFLTPEQAKPLKKGSLGLEHVEPYLLKKLIYKNIKFPKKKLQDTISRKDFFKYNLIGKKFSSIKRKFIAKKLHIDQGNAKFFLKELNYFQISKGSLVRTVKDFERNYSYRNTNSNKNNHK